VINLVKKFFAPTVKDESSAFYLAEQIIELKSRVEELEKENRELETLVLEVEVSLKAQIDKIHPVIYNISESNKGT
tara:strand:+ start:249 stop:476 length:228 start_codon:yes stop_codon:yes gene_type:complete